MKIKDVRLRGCGFTLFPAAEEMGVNCETARKLLWLSHMKAGAVDKDCICTENGMKQDYNPELPDSFTEAEINEMDGNVNDFVSAGLLEGADGVYSYSEKMKTILTMAAKKQSELDEEGFSFCPCHMW